MSGVDLSRYDGLGEAQEAGIEVDIVRPEDGKPFGWRITIVGPDSTAAKAFQREMIGELRSLQSNAEMTPELEEEYDLRRTVRCIRSWSPDPIVGGVQLPCTDENKLIVLRRYPFVLEQLRTRVQGRWAFMPRSASASAGRSETSTTEGGQESQP